MAVDRLEGPAAVVRALLAAAGVLAALLFLGQSPLAAAVERAGAPAVAAAQTAAPGTAASMEAPRSAVLVRTTGLAVLPAPTGPAAGLPPAHGPQVAPHLVAEPRSRPSTDRLATSARHGTSSRAPPGPAGT